MKRASTVVVMLVVLAACGGDDSASGDRSDTSGRALGAQTASCVESYSIANLKHRQLALDGIVKEVDGDHVTLKVAHWYRGGPGEEVTLSGASTLGGTTSAGASLALDAGTRLLVAGDDGLAWSCGFTQPYDEAIAKEWSDALAS